MSEINVNKIDKATGSTLTVGGAGTTVNISGTAGTGFPAGTTINNNAANRVITGSGTTGTLNGQGNLLYNGEQLTIQETGAGTDNLLVKTTGDNQISMAVEKSDLKYDIGLDENNDGSQDFFIRERSSGGVTTNAVRLYMKDACIGIGNTNADDYTSGFRDLVVGNSGSNKTSGITIACASNQTANLVFSTGTSGDALYKGRITYDSATNSMRFHIDGSAEKMRIAQDGKVLINTTSDLGNSQGVLHVKGKANNNIARFGAGTDGEGIPFVNASNTQVGAVQINSSSTAFQTSSDYRLKENETPISDGITRLKTLKPYRFNFIADNDANGNPTQTVDGFFAHEVTAVPEAISGTKDAMHLEILYTADDELPEGKEIGDIKEVAKPNYQGIDQSKLVPLLVAAVQELTAKVEALENA